MIKCTNCNELNESERIVCKKCQSKLLPGVSAKQRTKSILIGLVIFTIGTLLSFFIANLFTIARWAYNSGGTTSSTQTPEIFYYAGLAIFAVTCFETARRFKAGLTSTPKSLRYLQRAKNYIDIDLSQSLDDLIKSLEIIGSPKKSSTFLEISGVTISRDIKMCFEAYVLRNVIVDKISSSKITKLDQILVRSLIEILKDSRSDIKSKAARYLAQIGDPLAVKHVFNSLVKESDYDNSGKILAKFGKNALDSLIEKLDTPDWGSKILATKALAFIGDQKATQAITVLLKDKEWLIRKEAAEALGSIRDKRSLESLKELLVSEKKKAVINAVNNSIEKIREKKV